MGASGTAGELSPRTGLFRTRDFVVPYLAETQSVIGDQLGRVALSVLVFDRTSSAAWTALTYALTFLPAIAGGTLLGGLGDRFPRAAVMVGVDVLRALLFLGIAIPGVPLAVGIALVAIAFFLGPAFTAALVSQLADRLSEEQFRAASGIRMITSQAAQVAGFAVGGVVVAAVGAHAALSIDATTFAASAVIVGVLLLGRTTSGAGHSAPDGTTPERLVLRRDPLLRTLLLMVALSGFFVVPEGLAVPVAHSVGSSSSVAGFLLAAGPLGGALGAAALIRLVPQRHGLAVPSLMAVACGIPLIATFRVHHWPVVFACWTLSGVMWAYQVDVITAFVHAVADPVRSRAVARGNAVLLGSQGLGLAVFGGLSLVVGARAAVSVAGAAGFACASLLSVTSIRRVSNRTHRRKPAHRRPRNGSAPAALPD